jgi:hypothetical protein
VVRQIEWDKESIDLNVSFSAVVLSCQSATQGLSIQITYIVKSTKMQKGKPL